ncbi:MAG: lipopolysaccharide biosynthesis protein [Eubacteriales bacterium]|nr:lipopolysaccharide biosynthesis protein [Eubacteriales bacterium]
MSEKRSASAASSFLFKLTESFGNQIISFVVGILLARLLSPDDYGVLTLLMAFIAISQAFVQSGLNTALIQSRQVDELDRSSVFYVSLGMAAAMYVLLFLIAPALGAYYEMAGLAQYLRVLALALFPGAMLSVQNAVVAREMAFRKLMISSLLATVLSGATGIIMAMNGFGVWALVGQQLCNQFSLMVLLLLQVKWRPHFLFSGKRVGRLIAFGWKLLLSSLLDTGYQQLRSLVIGKKFNADALGSFNRGKQFPELVMNAVNGSIQSVMLPVLSEKQQDVPRMKQMMRLSVMVSSFLVLPLMAGLAAVATPLVRLLLTDKWLPCVPFMQICCIDFAFYPIHTANLQAINALGRSDVFLKLELIKKSYGVAILCVAVFCFEGVLPIVWGGVVSTLISAFVNATPNKRLIGYGYFEQLKDILLPIVMSLVMFAGVYGLSFLPLAPLPMLLVQVPAGVVIYGGLSYVCKPESFRYLLEMGRTLSRKLAEKKENL